MPVTHLAAIIGWPLDKTLSPQIHNAAFAALGLPWTYAPVAIRAGALEEGMGLLDTLGVEGANVTMPHKRDVMRFCSSLDPDAERIGAVNTLVRAGKTRWIGHNTDAAGFAEFLHEDAQLDPRSALVVGAGGAARAVVVALAGLGVRVIVTARRDKQATEVASLAPGVEVAPWGKRVTTDLVVQTTPIEGTELPEVYRLFTKDRAGIELQYGRETAFLAAARAASAPSFDGIGMLVRQAALAFTLWTGIEAPLEVMGAAARTRA